MSRIDVAAAALRLEALLPRVIAAVFRHEGDDPLSQVPVGQLRLLRTLFAKPRTATEVASELALSPSALTQMAQRLMRSGLIVKRDDPVDKRVRWLALSRDGAALMERRRAVRAAAVATVLGKMDPRRVALLLELLEEVLAAKASPGSRETGQDLASVL